MRAGRMRERIALLLKATTRDAMGGEVITWVDQGTVWAQAKPIRGREYFSALQVESELTITFCLRYRADVTSGWRVRWDGTDYEIVDVINVDAMDRELELMCRTVANV